MPHQLHLLRCPWDRHSDVALQLTCAVDRNMYTTGLIVQLDTPVSPSGPRWSMWYYEFRHFLIVRQHELFMVEFIIGLVHNNELGPNV